MVFLGTGSRRTIRKALGGVNRTRHWVLVKFGNTNCSECMLFEILGSVRAIAENPSHKGTIDVYKVWWGNRPDASFAGRIRDPERLNDLAKGRV